MGILTESDYKKIVEIFDEVLSKKEHVKSKYSLSEWAVYWFETYKTVTVSATTMQNYRSCVKNHIVNSFIADKNISDITVDDLQSLVNYVYSVKKLTRTTKLLYDILKQMFRLSTLLGETDKNVSEGLVLPSIKYGQRTPLTDEQIKLFLSVDNFDLIEKTFLQLALLAGLRRGEILAFSSSDIDFKRKIIFVSRTLEFSKNIGRLKNCPKSKAGIRTIPMVPLLEETLSQHSKPGFLFQQDDGSPYTKSQSYYLWQHIITKVKYYNNHVNEHPIELNPKKITPHVLRHTYATMLYYSEVGIKDAQYLLGHSSIEMTIDTYTHLKKYDLKNVNTVIEKVSSYLENLNT